jgi:hypothetical protein
MAHGWPDLLGRAQAAPCTEWSASEGVSGGRRLERCVGKADAPNRPQQRSMAQPAGPGRALGYTSATLPASEAIRVAASTQKVLRTALFSSHMHIHMCELNAEDPTWFARIAQRGNAEI